MHNFARNCLPWGLWQFTFISSVQESTCFPTAWPKEFVAKVFNICHTVWWEMVCQCKFLLLCVRKKLNIVSYVWVIFISFTCEFSVQVIYPFFSMRILSSLYIRDIKSLLTIFVQVFSTTLQFIFWLCSLFFYFSHIHTHTHTHAMQKLLKIY